KILLGLMKDPKTRSEAAVVESWERFLPIAIDRFKHTEFAFGYANRLRAKEKFRDAIKYYGLVAKKDPNYSAAVYNRMVTLTDLLYAVGPNKKPLVQGEDRAKLVTETLDTAETVKQQSLALI